MSEEQFKHWRINQGGQALLDAMNSGEISASLFAKQVWQAAFKVWQAAPPLPTDDERVRELEKDAARYRYLRDNCSSADEGGLGMIATDLQFTSLINHELVKKWPDALDKSIDQAIASMSGEQG